jgi:hypothetical protein
MHCDYQLAYWPITYIVALAFRDNAFENERLTPELVCSLRVPKRLHVLPLKFQFSGACARLRLVLKWIQLYR